MIDKEACKVWPSNQSRHIQQSLPALVLSIWVFAVLYKEASDFFCRQFPDWHHQQWGQTVLVLRHHICPTLDKEAYEVHTS
jgi:hypothetical protein